MTRILLVDDARTLLELGQSFLERSGCELTTVTTAAEALDAARSSRPDLIVMDVDLPGVDGITCCQRIKSDPELTGVPVVIATSPLEIPRCVTAGADGFVPKPVTRTRLVDVVRRFVPVAERASTRYPVGFKVEFVRNGVEGTGYALDLATGGLFLKTHDPLRRGDHIELSFTLPTSGASPIRALGEVIRIVTDESAPHHHAGAGIAFKALSARQRLEISRFLRERTGEAR